jgi:cytochrome c553
MGMRRKGFVLGLPWGGLLLSVLIASGCSDSPKEDPPDAGPVDSGVVDPAPSSCVPVRSGERIPMRAGVPVATFTETFDGLKARVDAQCAQCHAPPNIVGGFQYAPDLAGLKKEGARMALKSSQGEMPPLATPEQTKKAVELSCVINAWLQQGTPTGEFPVSCEDKAVGGIAVAPAVAEAMTDLGNCVPDATKPDALGSDPDKDAAFAAFTKLPPLLSDTDSDIMTFDAEKLARRGTFAFAPTYPLFSDHAKKLRQVHVPAGQSIRYDAQTGRFQVPPNTRFYKTFFKAVAGRDGYVRYQKIETRLILVREPWNKSLFGTYLWNSEGTVAQLHDLRYRDGEPFSDRVIVYTENEATGKTRNYAIPGAHRCVQCHTGAEAQNFVLGFTPLQLNRRAPGVAGVDVGAHIEADELDQVVRLVRAGVITGLPATGTRQELEALLPRLEDLSQKAVPQGNPAPGKETLELQGYYVGNCAQCHNPNGFATQSNPAIASLDFSAGGTLPAWNPCGVKESNGQRSYAVCDPSTVPDFTKDLLLRAPSSTLFQRVARDTDARLIHMPANVPGQDCRAAMLTARYLGALKWKGEESLPPAEQAARARDRVQQAELAVSASCTNPSDVRWITEDFTDKVPYTPRNVAWKEAIGKPPFERLTRYPITGAHEALAKQPFATNWWVVKAGCAFPAKPAPTPEEPWMQNELGNPRRPYGQLYYSTPGATAFQGICANCHGRSGDGQSGAAKTLVALNGARVANLAAGLFGTTEGQSNLLPFEAEYGPHGGARYLLWMASGGTTVKFTEEFMQAWVKYGEVDIDFSGDTRDWAAWGANMLGAARGACDLIRLGRFGTATPPSANVTSFGGTRMWTQVCTLDNPLTQAIREGTDQEAMEEWLQHAEFNVGVMAYFFIKDELTKHPVGWIYPLRTECEKRTTP